MTKDDLIIAIVSAIIGFVIQYTIITIVRIILNHNDFKNNGRIKVSGKWYATWQTFVENEECINTEKLKFKQRGAHITIKNTAISEDNKKGGYLWKGKLKMSYGKTLIGNYYPIKKEGNTSLGVLFFYYNSQSKIFYGKWLGCGYGGELIDGFVIISQDKEISKSTLIDVKEKHKGDISIIKFQI